MRTNDENKMYKLYESTNRKKQIVAYILESTKRNPWLFFDEQGPVAGAPVTPDATAAMDPSMASEEPMAGGEDPEKAKKMAELQTALMDLTAEDLINLMQKVVVAQQEAAAGDMGEEGMEDLAQGAAQPPQQQAPTPTV